MTGSSATVSTTEPAVEKTDYVIPSLDGSLLVHNGQGMRKTSVTARVITENAPFISEDGVAFVGKKNTRILGIDITDGTLVTDIGGGQDSVLKLSGTRGSTTEKQSLGRNKKKPGKNHSLMMGRVDYSLRAVDGASGDEKFNVTYSEMHPLVDNMQSLARSSKSLKLVDNALAQFLSGGIFGLNHKKSQRNGANDKTVQETSVVSTPEGYLYFADHDGNILQDIPIQLDSPAVNAYTIRVVDGEPRDAMRLPVHYSLNDIRHLYKIRSPKRSGFGIASRPSGGDTSKQNNSPQTIKSGSEVEMVMPDNDNIVLVQSVGRGVGDAANLYAMEIDPIDNLPDFIPDIEVLAESIKKPILALPSPAEGDSSKYIDINGEHFSGEVQSLCVPGDKAASRAPHSYLSQNLHKLKERGISLQHQPLHPLEHNTLKICDIEDVSSHVPGGIFGNQSVHTSSSLVHPDHNIKQIRGLHRLVDQSPHDDLWLPKFGLLQDRNGAIHKNPYAEEATWSSAPKVTSMVHEAFQWTVYFISGMVFFIFGICFMVLIYAVRHNKLSELKTLGGLIAVLFAATSQLLGYLGLPVPVPVTDKNTKSDGNEAVEVEIDEFGRHIFKVGALSVYDTVLGYGSHGTVVFYGKLNGRPVAVKRMLSQLHRSADRYVCRSIIMNL